MAQRNQSISEVEIAAQKQLAPMSFKRPKPEFTDRLYDSGLTYLGVTINIQNYSRTFGVVKAGLER